MRRACRSAATLCQSTRLKLAEARRRAVKAQTLQPDKTESRSALRGKVSEADALPERRTRISSERCTDQNAGLTKTQNLQPAEARSLPAGASVCISKR